MSATRWLESRLDGVPPRLGAQLRTALSQADATDRPTPNRLLDAGERVLRDVLAATPMTRAQAVPLLCADALITYAMDAAAADPERFAAAADVAMRRIGALAGEGAGQ